MKKILDEEVPGPPFLKGPHPFWSCPPPFKQNFPGPMPLAHPNFGQAPPFKRGGARNFATWWANWRLSLNIGHLVGKLDTELKIGYQFPHLVGKLYPNLINVLNGGQIVHRLKRRSPICPPGGEILNRIKYWWANCTPI